MTMWVMAASPLLTNNDVRKMSPDIKAILTNPEVLAVHKDPLVKVRVFEPLRLCASSVSRRLALPIHPCSSSSPPSLTPSYS